MAQLMKINVYFSRSSSLCNKKGLSNRVKALIVPTNEELMIAREVVRVVQ